MPLGSLLTSIHGQSWKSLHQKQGRKERRQEQSGEGGGYNLDKEVCKTIGINGAKLYVQGKNLGMLYSSIDFMDLDTGWTYFNRGFTVGLQVEF